MHAPLPFGVRMALARRLTPLALVVFRAGRPRQSGGLGVKGKTGQPVLENQGVYVVVVGDLKLS